MISVFLKMFIRILFSNYVLLIEGRSATSHFSEAVGKTANRRLRALLFILQVYNLNYYLFSR
jgi:hypothetical protein